MEEPITTYYFPGTQLRERPLAGQATRLTRATLAALVTQVSNNLNPKTEPGNLFSIQEVCER